MTARDLSFLFDIEKKPGRPQPDVATLYAKRDVQFTTNVAETCSPFPIDDTLFPKVAIAPIE